MVSSVFEKVFSDVGGVFQASISTYYCTYYCTPSPSMIQPLPFSAQKKSSSFRWILQVRIGMAKYNNFIDIILNPNYSRMEANGRTMIRPLHPIAGRYEEMEGGGGT